MNYYAQGGQAHGLKSLARELPKYGRYGDDVVAHISSDEARMLQQMGGSGTINPTTGLPEFFNPIKAIKNVVVKPVQAVYNATLKNIPGVDQALVGLDKTVGSAIPGGWNTLAQTALAFTPLGLPAKVGLAALGGSGALGPKGKFNLQRAILSGAMAYGANQLAQGFEAAGSGADATATQVASDIGKNVAGGVSMAPGSQAAMLADQVSGLGAAGAQNIASSAAAPTSAFGNFVGQTGQNLAAAGQGIKNLTGFGPQGVSGIGPAATNFAAPVTAKGMTALGVGAMGISDLDAQQDYLNSQQNAQNSANSDYNQQMAIIESNRKRAEDAMRSNPYQFAEGGNVATYAKGGEAKERREFLDMINASVQSPPAQYVEGLGLMAAPQSVGGRLGANVDALGGNVRAGISGNAMMSPENKIMARPEMFDVGYKTNVGGGDLDIAMQRAINSMPGRGKDYALSARYSKKFAEGGMPPRFLSGGGDGMSDSIKATINDKQEARLADGEFVIPADVVSHLGNGSSKAGAKRLYSMMDKVRLARTGNKKQGKEINPMKFMPA